MQKRKLTQEDLDNNPELVEQGLQVGDEIEIPEEENTASDETFDPGGDDTGGSNPPANKPRP